MGSAQGQKHTFSRSDVKDLIVNVGIQSAVQHIEELMFTRVNMRWRFGAALHRGKHQVEGSASDLSVANWVLRMPLYQVDISSVGACLNGFR